MRLETESFAITMSRLEGEEILKQIYELDPKIGFSSKTTLSNLYQIIEDQLSMARVK